MAETVTITCDRCGATGVPPDGKSVPLHYGRLLLTEYGIAVDGDGAPTEFDPASRAWHVCDACYPLFLAWLESA